MILATIRNPKIEIANYKSIKDLFDLNACVQTGKRPIFYPGDPPINFGDKKLHWDFMLELIKSKELQKIFW